MCIEDSLDKSVVEGKIVLCDSFVVPKKTATLVRAGAVGLVMQGASSRDVAYSYPLPASYLDVDNGGDVHLYINSQRSSSETIIICFYKLLQKLPLKYISVDNTNLIY